jgi:hypothetical protein
MPSRPMLVWCIVELALLARDCKLGLTAEPALPCSFYTSDHHRSAARIERNMGLMLLHSCDRFGRHSCPLPEHVNLPKALDLSITGSGPLPVRHLSMMFTTSAEATRLTGADADGKWRKI